MPSDTVIDVLLARYLAANPGYCLPSGDKHPAFLALSLPVSGWITNQMDRERFWRHLLSAAKVWFAQEFDPRAYKYLCVRFEGECNALYSGSPEFDRLSNEYRQWRKEMAPNKSFKPNPLRGSA